MKFKHITLKHFVAKVKERAMAKKKNWMGILVMVLVFGFVVMGCGGNDNGDTNFLDTLGLSTSPPTAGALAARGLTLAQFEQIRDAAAGGFRGWTLEYGFVMAWTGRSLANFTALATVLDTIFGEEYRGVVYGVHRADGDRYGLRFFPSRSSIEGGYYVSAGTMFVMLFGD